MNYFSLISADFPIIYHIIIGIAFGFVILLAYMFNNRKKTLKLFIPKEFVLEQLHLDKIVPILNKIYSTRCTNVLLDVSQVENISEGAYMVLVAQAEKAYIKDKDKRIQFYSLNPRAKKIIEIIGKQKGYAHINVKVFSEGGQGDKEKAISDRYIDTDLADRMVSELKRIGIREYYQPFYDLLIEVIGNATEHGIQNKNINWWLLRYRDYQERCMRYVFVDMGLGIIESYKKSGLLNKYSEKNLKQIPIDALNGRLGSSTREDGRGRGLPQIREAIEKEIISDFVLITNRVSLRYINGKFTVSTNPNFVGTYFSWSISKNNYYAWKNTQ